jgi:hypothetical protein
VAGSLRLTLQPGWYALVFGSGRFGATGDGGSFNNNIPDGVSQIYAIRTSDGAIFFQAPGARLFVDSAPVPVFSILVDTDTNLPGSSQVFTGFGPPALAQGEIAFMGRGEFGSLGRGLYKTVDGVLTSVANEGTQIPGTTTWFDDFDDPSIDNGAVVFFGERYNSVRGYSTDVGGTLQRVIDSNTTTPGGTDPFVFPRSKYVSIDDGDVTFCGNYESVSAGVYKWREGTLDVVANQATLIPGAGVPFESFDDLYAPIDAGTTGFVGGTTVGGIVGLYKATDAGLQMVYDNTMPLPDGGGNMDRMGFVRLRDGRVAFGALNLDFTAGGIYTDASGTLEPFLTFATPVPGGTGTFQSFTVPSFDGKHVAAAGRDEAFANGIYTDVVGEVVPLLTEGAQVAGKTVSQLNLGAWGLEANKLVFWARFTDDSAAIVQARYPAPPGDVDDDGDVDLADAARLAECYGGAFQPPAAGDCDAADFNGDTDVDDGDFGGWLDCVSGPGESTPCGY